MKKATITIAFDSEKLDALEFSLHKEHSSAQAYLESALNAAYEKAGSIWTVRLSLRPSPSAPLSRPHRSRRATSRNPI